MPSGGVRDGDVGAGAAAAAGGVLVKRKPTGYDVSPSLLWEWAGKSARTKAGRR
jgi:hypothetical protein